MSVPVPLRRVVPLPVLPDNPSSPLTGSQRLRRLVVARRNSGGGRSSTPATGSRSATCSRTAASASSDRTPPSVRRIRGVVHRSLWDGLHFELADGLLVDGDEGGGSREDDDTNEGDCQA